MYSTVLSGAIYGIDSYLVQVEVDMSSGLPCFAMVGSLGGEVKESGERVRIALKNMGIHLPPMHVAVNLSPADIKKEGTAFDLPIAAGLLCSMEKIRRSALQGILLLGELGLDGKVRPVKGVLPIIKKAHEAGIERCLIPEGNVREAGRIQGIKIVGVPSLSTAIEYLNTPPQRQDMVIAPFVEEEPLWMREDTEGKRKSLREGGDEPVPGEPDFCEIVGQESVKRAALIAAAGFHNLLIVGPPGSGKTMTARRLPSILPLLTGEEILEVSSIYSIAGLLDEDTPYISRRPFLNPHHTISPQALTGGGRIPRPGVISLSHRGVLFLDEMAEFKKQTLDLLRQPMEDRRVQIARSCGSFSYPADFMLVGASNPCPCGYYPDRNRCRCTPFEVRQYFSRISGPILDRLDIRIFAPQLKIGQLQGGEKGETSTSMRKKVTGARIRQQKRFEGTRLRFNADLGAGDIEKYCPLGRKEKQLMEELFQSLGLSARAYHRMIKVARTIADVEGRDAIGREQLLEAACYYSGEEAGFGNERQ